MFQRFLIAVLSFLFAVPSYGLDVNGQLKNALAEKLASDPVTNVLEGRFYWNTTAHAFKFYDATSWRTALYSGGALGTPASGTATNLTGLPLTTGVTGTLPVANGGTGVTSSTGSGSTVLSTSPTLVTPILGTPTSGTATNLTGLPLTTGVTGTLPVANGGTGQTSATAAFNALDPLAAKGSIITHDGSNSVTQTVGTNGQVLTADSTQTNGIKWADGGAGGSGEINANTNPSAASATTGYSNGTSHTISRVTSSSPLDPITTTAFSISATANGTESSTSGSYYSISTLPTGLRNRKLKVEFYYTAATAADTWRVSVYAGSTRMNLSTDSSGVSSIPTGVTGAKFSTTFDADTSTAYTVNITRTAGSGTTTFLFTNMVVGPGIQPQGAAAQYIGSIGTWTVTGNGSKVFTITDKCSRVGTKLECDVLVSGNSTASGSAGATDFLLVMPAGYTADSTAVTGVDDKYNGGYYTAFGVTASTYTSEQQLRLTSTTSFGFVEAGGATSISIADLNASRAMIFTAHFSLPISEWSGNGTVNLAQNDCEYSYNSGTWDAADSTSFAYGPVGGSISGSLTADRSKRVRFRTPISPTDSLTLKFSDGTVWLPVGSDVGQLVTSYNRQNTLFYGANLFRVSASTTDVDVQFGQYRYPSGSTFGSAGANWSSGYFWRVEKCAGGQAVGFGKASQNMLGLVKSGQFPGTNTNDSADTGNVGEKICTTSTTSFSQSTPSDATWYDDTNLTVALTAGQWFVFAQVNAVSNWASGAAAGSAVQASIRQGSTIIANSVGGLSGDPANYNDIVFHRALMGDIVNITGSTTYKISVGVFSFAGSPVFTSVASRSDLFNAPGMICGLRLR